MSNELCALFFARDGVENWKKEEKLKERENFEKENFVLTPDALEDLFFFIIVRRKQTLSLKTEQKKTSQKENKRKKERLNQHG